MPILKANCPECDTGVRRTVNEPGEYKLKCPDCGHRFFAELEGEDDRPRYQPRAAGKSHTPILVGAIAGGVLLVGAILGLAFAFSGPKDKPVAKADPPAKAAPPTKTAPPKANPTPAPATIPATTPAPVEPNPTPMPVTPAPAGPPAGMPDPPDVPDGPVVPAAGVPVLPPGEDVFARAATFKLDGPLPELPPLPPVERRPMLALDSGGHTAFVKHVFFTPDADRVITVSEDKSVRAWDVLSGEPVYTVRLPAGPDIEGTPFGAAMSPDGKLLAVGGFPLGRGKFGVPFYLLSVATGELVAIVDGAKDSIRSLGFSPDGKRIAVGSVDGVLQVYDLPSKKWVFRALAHTDAVDQVRFSPKGGLLATIGYDKEIKIWELTNATNFAAQMKLTEEKPNDAAWTSDGKTLAVGCTDGTVRLYDGTGKLLKTVPPALENGKAPIQIVRLRFLPGDKQIVFGGVAALGWAGVADLATGEHPVIVRDHTNTVMAVDRSADGALAVTAGGEFNEILVWDVKTGALVRRFQAASKGLWAVGWAKDGKALAWGTTNRFIDGLCALEQTLRLDEFLPGPPPKPGDFVRHVRDDGTFSVKVDNFFEFTVLENGKPLYRHKSELDRIYSVTLLPGKGIVVGAAFGAYLLDTKTGNQLRSYRASRGLTTALAPSPDGQYFVSGSSDHVMRVWAHDREEPVLSVFAVGREWIAWTPQGYYACSPYGERLIAWQVNNGIDKLPAVHPAVRFRASLYQPALIKYLIPAGDMRLALAMANKFERQSIAVTGLAEVLPPEVTLSAPATATDKPVLVRAVAEGTAKNPIVAMRLLVDGRPYNGAAGVRKFDKQAKAEATWNVTLGPGAHTLAVLAESPVSKGMSPSVSVTRGGPASLPNLYVLAVGVSAYPGSMKLNYAASDALLLTRTLQEKSRTVFGKIEMKVLTDKEGTKLNIREGLEWLKSKMTDKDVGIFFFSGHGGRDDDTGKFYLIPVDVGRDIDKTCFSGEELKSRLEDMPGRLVAILDACHSGAVTEIKPAQADNLVRDLMTDDYGVVVLASSLGRECSLESTATRAGFYTLGLTEGMRGRADLNRDGVVFLNELERYAALRVQQLSGGQQNPTMGRPPNVKPFPIAKP